VPRIVLIAGEASGDQLGRGLIESLRARYPDAVFEGITGPKMRAAGCESWGDYEQLAVMGIFEVLAHLPRIWRLKKELQKRLRANPPDVLIGIDAPDFNLRLETFARGIGIPTVQYVCPSVWAWRSGRVKAIARACDLVLCLLPFERDFVVSHGINAIFVGHPLADEIKPEERSAARSKLGLGAEPLVALLPGSRVGELKRLAQPFLDAVTWLRSTDPQVAYVAAAATEDIADIFAADCRHAGLAGDIEIVTGKTKELVAAADAVLLASGTATLETMLLLRPMVVAYRINPLTAWLLRLTGIVRIKFFALPNLLAGRELVPEFIQEQVSGPALGAAVQEQLRPGEKREQLLLQFRQLGDSLRRSASDEAAAAVAALITSRGH
jgi:lipid-A-disaccharide synthase